MANREIKFRGKSGKIWVVGSLISNKDYTRAWIMTQTQHAPINTEKYGNVIAGLWEVDPETVGQFTGKKDSKRVDIYEKDKVDVIIKGVHYISIVEWGNKRGGFRVRCMYDTGYPSFNHNKYYAIPLSKDIKVIGNIHQS